MHPIRYYAAYGWLTFMGTMHFLADVAWPLFRRSRAPGDVTTLSYCLDTSFALGQVALGALGLWLSLRAPAAVRATPVIVITLGAAAGWLALTFFMEHWQPRVNAAICLTLVLATALPGGHHRHGTKSDVSEPCGE